MPEGVEVTLSVEEINNLFSGEIIRAVQLHNTGRYSSKEPAGYQNFASAVRDGYMMEAARVKGKFSWWTFKKDLEPDWYMMCTYGMTGKWTTRPMAGHAVMSIMSDELTTTFIDQRRFGTLSFTSSAEALASKLKSIGPDMLNAPPDDEEFIERMMFKSNRTIAEALMDQSCVSGVGNYLKCESLYAAKISPHRPVSSLTHEDFADLRSAIIMMMNLSYELGGAYSVGPDGTSWISDRFSVYNQVTDPHGFPVEKKATADGRTTYWCPKRQK